MEIFALILSLIIILIGIAGTILPALPGPILVYLGFVVYGALAGFDKLGLSFFLISGIIVAILYFLDIYTSKLGTKLYGGSKEAGIGAAIGLFIGLIALGPIGIILGPLLGAFLVELFIGKEVKDSFISGLGSLVGLLGGTIFKILIEIAMVIYFLIKIF